MTINITADVVREGLTALVEQAGEDFVYVAPEPPENGYKRCLYVRDGKPDCIVGQFLANLGVPVDRLTEADNGTNLSGTPAGILLRELYAEGVVNFDLGVSAALGTAQAWQDSGSTWGNSVESALSYLDSIRD